MPAYKSLTLPQAVMTLRRAVGDQEAVMNTTVGDEVRRLEMMEEMEGTVLRDVFADVARNSMIDAMEAMLRSLFPRGRVVGGGEAIMLELESRVPPRAAPDGQPSGNLPGG
jgi:hypothetical protein